MWRVLFLILGLSVIQAHARVPVLHVVDIAFYDGIPPALCKGIRVGRRSVGVDASWQARLRKRRGRIDTGESGTDRIEDARYLIMLRKPKRCRALFLRSPISLPAGLRPFAGWRFSDGVLVLLGDKTNIRLAPGKHVREPAKGDSFVVVHNYGTLEVYFKLPVVRPVMTRIDNSVSGAFTGPGDVRRYRLQTPQAGLLVVEYHSDHGPGSIDIEIRDSHGRLLGTGGASINSAETVDIVLRYRGTGSSAFSAGFLFSPDTSLACRLEVRRIARGMMDAAIIVENQGRTVAGLARPAADTTAWYADDRLIGIARPGRGSSMVMLPPGKRMRYTTRLIVPAGTRSLYALLDTGRHGRIRCGPVVIRPDGQRPASRQSGSPTQ